MSSAGSDDIQCQKTSCQVSDAFNEHISVWLFLRRFIIISKTAYTVYSFALIIDTVCIE